MILSKRLPLIVSLATFCCFLLTSSFYIIFFPPKHWSVLWQKQLGYVPVILVAALASLVIGFVLGFLVSYFLRSVVLQLTDTIGEIVDQTNFDKQCSQSSSPLQPVYAKLDQLAQKLREQTQLTQKLANETATLEEQAVQKVISEERNRLARELHDSVSQQLFAASMLLSTINEGRTDKANNESHQLQLVERTIHQSQLEMRALFLHLRPVQLHGKALKIGMEELLGELQMKVPLTISWSIEAVPLEKGIEDQLFRILQESVSNVLRHAAATTLNVLLLAPEHHLILRISDNGTGFDTKTSKPGAYGLQNMRERAAQIGGHLKIVSIPRQGTILEVNIPILKEG
ncbi:MAG: sensor histidine kinase [Sporolactobacillus sp.]